MEIRVLIGKDLAEDITFGIRRIQSFGYEVYEIQLHDLHKEELKSFEVAEYIKVIFSNQVKINELIILGEKR